ncbi:MAG: InlB B-repeat-containing protein [Bacilli bacterium]|nr:InlB B-repeat-containing protein [Bacilli bacterium]
MRKNKKLLIVFLLVLISIGFAYLTSTLEINGITGIGRNTWNIYFDNVVNLSGANLATTAPTTSGTNTKSISYSVNLNKPGDAYRFNVDIVNGGTLDAMITVLTNTTLTAEQAKYVEYSVTYADETPLVTKNKLSKNSSDKLLVSVIYKDNITEDDMLEEDINIDIDLSIKYEQADSTAQARSTGQLNVKFDYNYNMISDFDDKSSTTVPFGTYYIQNNKITFTSSRTDGYAILSKEVDIVKNNMYYFYCDSDGTWGLNNAGDTVQIFFISKQQEQSGQIGNYAIMINDGEWYFNGPYTDTYKLRVDSNQNGATHSFWNLFLTEYTQSNFNVGANLVLPTAPTRDGYTFDGWYTERVGGTQVTTSTKVNYSTTYYAHWTEA